MEPTNRSMERDADHLAHSLERLAEILKEHTATAKAELKREIRSQSIVAVAMGTAAALALGGLLMLLVMGIDLFAYVVPVWAAALIVGAIALAGAGLAALVGLRKLEKPKLQQTRKLLEGDAEAIRLGAREGLSGRPPSLPVGVPSTAALRP